MGLPARLLLVAALFLSMSPAGMAASDAYVDDYMQKSGLARQLARAEPDVLGVVDRAFPEAKPQLTPEQQERMRSAVKMAYGADRLRRSVRAHLAAVLPQGDTELYLKWLDSPLGKRITEIEVAGATVAASTTASAGASPASATLSAERRALLERILKAAGLSDLNASMLITQQIGLARAMVLVTGQPFPDIPTGGAVRDRLEPYRRKIVEALGPRLLEQAAILYVPLSDEDLRVYASTLERSSPRRVLEASGAAVERALLEAAIELGRLVSDPAQAEPGRK